MPALYNLSSSRLLNDGFKIIGVDRAALDDAAWKKSLTDTMHSYTKDKSSEFYTPCLDETAWGWVADRMHYLQGDFGQDEVFQKIGKAIGQDCTIFYLAIAGRFFGTVVDGLGRPAFSKKRAGHFAGSSSRNPSAPT